MGGRLVKQLVVVIVFLLILSFVGYGIYRLFTPSPTCFDNIKNGQEEGLDCGSLACGKQCEPEIMPIKILSSQFFEVGPGDYDFVAKLSNPNSAYGASRLDYIVEPFNVSGFTYILPGETKFLVLTSLTNGSQLTDIKLTIKNVEWQKLDLPENSVNFILRQQIYGPIPAGSQFDGLLSNESSFDFDKVDVVVLLFDESDSIIGANRTNMDTFISKSSRGFSVQWPFPLSAKVGRQEVQASTNLFENSNYIKSYGSPEKFQKFYQ